MSDSVAAKLDELVTHIETAEKGLHELMKLVSEIRNKLVNGDMHQWDDGDKCWPDMHEVADYYDKHVRKNQ